MTQQNLTRLQATVVALATPAPDVCVVHVRLAGGAPLGFKAGQYVRLWFGALAPRDYSLGSRPGEPNLEFHIRIMSESETGSYVGSTLRVGETVGIAGPFGDAFLREQHLGAVIAVAGGTGVVPIKSIVETALASGMRQPMHLYLGARTGADLYAEAHFRALAARHANLHVTTVVSEGNGQGRLGNVADAVAQDFAALPGFKAYVAGPPAMVAATRRVLEARGLPPAEIHVDPFLPGDHHSANLQAAAQ